MLVLIKKMTRVFVSMWPVKSLL